MLLISTYVSDFKVMVVADLKIINHFISFQLIFDDAFCLQISCKVKAKFTNDPDHDWSDTVTTQQPFFAGITVRRNLFTPLRY